MKIIETLRILGSHYGEKVWCMRLNPDGDKWERVRLTIDWMFLKEVEGGSILVDTDGDHFELSLKKRVSP